MWVVLWHDAKCKMCISLRYVNAMPKLNPSSKTLLPVHFSQIVFIMDKDLNMKSVQNCMFLWEMCSSRLVLKHCTWYVLSYQRTLRLWYWNIWCNLVWMIEWKHQYHGWSNSFFRKWCDLDRISDCSGELDEGRKEGGRKEGGRKEGRKEYKLTTNKYTKFNEDNLDKWIKLTNECELSEQWLMKMDNMDECEWVC